MAFQQTRMALQTTICLVKSIVEYTQPCLRYQSLKRDTNRRGTSSCLRLSTGKIAVEDTTLSRTKSEAPMIQGLCNGASAVK